jgi:hypothetical protein
MKNVFLLLFTISMIFALRCSSTSEFDIVMNVTNPQGKAVKFSGYYLLEATGDSVPMGEYTPETYSFTMQKGDRCTGLVYKDTVDVTDTLNLRILSNDDEKVNLSVTFPYPLQAIQFDITAQ